MSNCHKMPKYAILYLFFVYMVYIWTITRTKNDSEVEGKFTFHILRHTFACRMLKQTQDLYRVSKWLGHSSSKVTELDEKY